MRLGPGRVSGAVTVVAVGERADSDFVGLGLLANPGYTRVDARLRAGSGRRSRPSWWRRTCSTSEYQEALGYPALGRSVRGGLRLRLFGASRP